MTTEEFIKLAREAGFVHSNPHSEIIVRHSSGAWVSIEERLHQFALLVASAEREACAKVCDSFVDLAEAERAKLRTDYARSAGDEEDELRAMRNELTVSTFNAGISKCAAAIRARSQK